jgi:hypothetical protein
MKTKEIIQRIQSLYSKGVKSDDSRLSSRHIYNKALTTRAFLIEQKLDKRQPISQSVYQTLDCVELIPALPYECPCLPEVGCKILRTKYQIPQLLTGLLEGAAIQSVNSVEGSLTFNRTTFEDKKYKKGNKYTASKPDYYIRNDYIYITCKDAPKVITITGLFDDPLDAWDYPSICGADDCVDATTESTNPTNCPECVSPLDKEFPIEKSMIKTLVEIASTELIGMFNQSREDKSNNTKDSTTEETK